MKKEKQRPVVHGIALGIVRKDIDELVSDLNGLLEYVGLDYERKIINDFYKKGKKKGKVK